MLIASGHEFFSGDFDLLLLYHCVLQLYLNYSFHADVVLVDHMHLYISDIQTTKRTKYF